MGDAGGSDRMDAICPLAICPRTPPATAADDPSAKQQWLHALGWWCQDGEKLAAIDAM